MLEIVGGFLLLNNGLAMTIGGVTKFEDDTAIVPSELAMVNSTFLYDIDSNVWIQGTNIHIQCKFFDYLLL